MDKRDFLRKLKHYRDVAGAIWGGSSNPTRPHLIEIEVSTYCTAECIYCPRERLTRSRENLPEDRFKDVLKWLKKWQYPFCIFFSGMGEPLMNKHLPTFVRMIKSEMDCFVGINTNASLMTSAVSEALLSAGTDFFHISIPTDNEEIYRLMIHGLNFRVVAANVEQLLDKAKWRSIVVIVAVQTDLNKSQYEGLTHRWRRAGASDVVRIACHSRGGHLEADRILKVSRVKGFGRCLVFEHMHVVDVQGHLLPCVHDIVNDNVLGTVDQLMPKDMLREKARIRSSGEGFAMCKNCDFLTEEMSLQVSGTV